MAFNQSQLQAIRHAEGPALILAGPGSGKTTVITNRIRYLAEERGTDPSSILVITFTRAAAREMQERYGAMVQTGCKKPAFGTFHSVFFLILRLAYRYEAGSIVKEEQRAAFIRDMMAQHQLEVEDENEFISGVLSEISAVKGEMLNLDHYYARNCPEEIFKKLYRGYESRLRKGGLLDFDDMLVMCHQLFEQRPDILQAWQRKYRFILIDEFQDINRIQYEIVRMLASPANNLFIVGDDDQSIYRFRGARPEIMLGFERDYPDAVKILLDTNYRSTREIIASAGQVIRHNETRFIKTVQDVRGPGRCLAVKMWDNPRSEARAIATQLRDYRRLGVDYGDIAVLYRTNLGPRLLVEVLMEYNIPFHMRDTLPNLYEHWIARDLFAYIRAAGGDMSRANLLRIINRPVRYISREALDSQTVSLESVKSFYQDKEWMIDRVERLEYDFRSLRTMPPSKAVNYIRKAVGYDDYIRDYARERSLDFQELFEILDQLQDSAAGFETMDQWQSYMAQYREKLAARSLQSRKKKEGVSLMTMHSSKGLEFRVVFILDANEGVTPHHKAVLKVDLEEERRMFYVAMTRARDRLHIYYVKERYHKKQEVSRFVKEAMEE